MHTPQDTQFLHHKFQILHRIVGIILDKIDSEELDTDEAKIMANYVLKESDKSNNPTTLQYFLNQLALRWKMFELIRNEEAAKDVLRTINDVDSADTAAKLDDVRKQLSGFINNSGSKS